MNITNDFLTVSKFSRSGQIRTETKAIVIHYIGNAGQSGKGARNYFEDLKAGIIQDGSLRYASVQYVVGLQGEVLQLMPDEEVGYHCGAQGKLDPASGKLYTDKARSLFPLKYTTNPDFSPSYATIGIEVCHPDWTGKFKDVSLNSLIELVSMLCKKYNLDPSTQVIRHIDVTGAKKCPLYYVDHPTEFTLLTQAISDHLKGLPV